MHVSERLLQLYANMDAVTRAAIQQKIVHSLNEGTPLTDSYVQLTGDMNLQLSIEPKTANSFIAWLEGRDDDSDFLPYYVGILEKKEVVLDSALIQPVAPLDDDLPVIEPKATKSSSKPRYTPEVPVPSRAERSKYQSHIEPARPRRKVAPVILSLVAALVLLIGGGYMAYPLIASYIDEPKEEVVAENPVEPEPVVETPEVNDVWVTVKNTSLLKEPGSDQVVYIGDIGDRYTILDKKDDYTFVNLGANDMSAWIANADVTSDWKKSDITDTDLLKWVTENVDQSSLQTTVETYLAMSREQVITSIGEPNATDEDALNEYLFYNGLFFVIQDGTVHAIDWTNTDQTKESFLDIGTPTSEAEDAVVYETESYSLRLFIGSNGATRIRLSELN